MRVTNSMISNSSRSHIANAKYELMKRENQYTTQKKILRPSDDPTIAIRSLQLRTTYSQIEQYADKNVKDAIEWMDTTDSALEQIDNILTLMKPELSKGYNDYLGLEERHSVLSVLKEYSRAIFEDQANADYSGRYMFTGYRTDTSLLFPNDVTNLEYEIKQKFTSNDIDTIKYVSGGAEYKAHTSADVYAAQVPKQDTAYHLKLAYDNCANSAITGAVVTPPATTPPVISITLSATSSTPAGVTPPAVTVKSMASTDVGADDFAAQLAGPPAVDALYLYDTGEVIFSSGIYSQIQENSFDMEITYNKKEFDKGDIRPEMYFECTSYNTDSKKTIPYRDPEGQKIQYEVNFSQLATVNTQARDAINTDMYRAIDYLEKTILKMDDIEKQIKDAETMIANETDETEKANLEKLKEMLETEQRLQVGCMTEAFGKGLTMVSTCQQQINVALADLGSRQKRVELTYDQLSDQKVDTEEKLSENEDIDIADAYINLTQADNLYQASLTATSKILGNSLLNYI